MKISENQSKYSRNRSHSRIDENESQKLKNCTKHQEKQQEYAHSYSCSSIILMTYVNSSKINKLDMLKKYDFIY